MVFKLHALLLLFVAVAALAWAQQNWSTMNYPSMFAVVLMTAFLCFEGLRALFSVVPLSLSDDVLIITTFRWYSVFPKVSRIDLAKVIAVSCEKYEVNGPRRKYVTRDVVIQTTDEGRPLIELEYPLDAPGDPYELAAIINRKIAERKAR